ncbi:MULTISPECIES: hypothetical protein [unclassified Bradyrhizobium]|uniref:hypothetical protein n=1 Tax=unclassified Bradyrhizobium TaxID=2631580 RepID=UPI00291691AF|nr:MULTISPECIES: hypothetical protein [unclassified Bradyrhizobium]
MSDQTPDVTTSGAEAISMVEFLESKPPGKVFEVGDLIEQITTTQGRVIFRLNTPRIHIHCDSPECSGNRYFKYVEGDRQKQDENKFFHTFITYRCSNCEKKTKAYALFVEPSGAKLVWGRCFKLGEMPPFGPVTPTRLLKMLGSNNTALFMKGRRCESQGLGIGAFVYYRRVVEDQRSAILDQIIRVAKTINAPAEMIATLEEAKAENQFSKSLDMVKEALPESLRIQGHNPLTLLHDNLSSGLHAQTDAECLDIATSIRVVLADLAERISLALKDEAELTKALGKLLNKQRSGDQVGVAIEAAQEQRT